MPQSEALKATEVCQWGEGVDAVLVEAIATVNTLDDEVLERDPDDIAANCRRVQYRLGRGELDRAFEALRKLERLPDSGLGEIEATRNYLGAEYRVARYRRLDTAVRSEEGGRLLEEARRRYRIALDFRPGWAKTWIRLGQSYEYEAAGDAEPGGRAAAARRDGDGRGRAGRVAQARGARGRGRACRLVGPREAPGARDAARAGR